MSHVAECDDTDRECGGDGMPDTSFSISVNRIKQIAQMSSYSIAGTWPGALCTFRSYKVAIQKSSLKLNQL